jgi:hypothetical protein
MSTEILSQYIEELLAGRERPLQEYLLEHPETRDELLPLLVGALAIHRSVAGIDLLTAKEEASRHRALEELAKVIAERDDLTANGALSRLVHRLRGIISRSRGDPK